MSSFFKICFEEPLSGHAMLNVYDDVFAKVMLGWLNVEQYLFRAHACYRGHAGYDINILKVWYINILCICLTKKYTLIKY